MAGSYKALRKLEFTYNDPAPTFILPHHTEQNLSDVQIAENLADYFSAISQEFEPLVSENLAPSVRDKIEAARFDQTKPCLEEWQVYRRLPPAKKPNATVPGDLPVQLVKEFMPELAKPVSLIYNKITESGQYPRQWVIEYQIGIPKKGGAKL